LFTKICLTTYLTEYSRFEILTKLDTLKEDTGKSCGRRGFYGRYIFGTNLEIGKYILRLHNGNNRDLTTKLRLPPA
jgi:hypothetical protein